MPIVTIPESDLRAFEDEVALACLLKSESRLEAQVSLPSLMDAQAFELPSYFRSSEGSLVLSFDGSWYPFLCNTAGYNVGPDRWYLRKNPLTAKLGLRLQEPIMKRLRFRPGGRLFLDSSGARMKPNASYVDVLEWQLPRATDWLLPRAKPLVMGKAIPRRRL
jgi:hypothetical protein